MGYAASDIQALEHAARGQEICATAYYACQDANYNVLALVDSAGDAAEHYEYTPYGRRTVYTSPGSNDPLALAPTTDSRPVSGVYGTSVTDAFRPFGAESVSSLIR